jgi:hypothetical protein
MHRFILLLLLCPLSLSAQGMQHWVWDKKPIAITLPLHQERLITLPESVSIDAKGSHLSTQDISMLNNHGTLYFTAHHPFKSRRIFIHAPHSHHVVIMDISAQANASDDPIAILWAQKKPLSIHQPPGMSPTITPISVLRFALQQQIAEQPTLVLSQMHTIALPSVQLSTRTLHLKPLHAWQGGSYYVLVLQVTNISKRPQYLDLNGSIGQWMAGVIYPTDRLAPQAHTLLLLLSRLPLAQALGQAHVG